MSGNVTHLGLPLRLDARGRTATVDQEEYLRGLVESVLFTRPGERVNRPTFGSGVDRLVFAPTGDETTHTTQALVQAALQQWLGDQLRVDEIAVVANDSRLTVTVAYTPLRAPAGDGRRVVQVTGGAP
jgi:phage baseplate assembly protein W